MEISKEAYYNSLKTLPKSMKLDLETAKYNVWHIINELKPNYDFTHYNKPKILELTKYFIDDPTCIYDLKKGIGLFGANGVGKSFLMEVFRLFANKLKHKQFEIVNCKEFVTEISIKEQYELIQDYTLRPICFDELMKEAKGKKYGFDIDTMDYILSKRHRMDILTHYISNKTPDDIITTYNKDVDSRAHSMFNFIFLDSEKDYRK